MKFVPKTVKRLLLMMLTAEPAAMVAVLLWKEQFTMAPMELSSDRATAPALHT